MSLLALLVALAVGVTVWWAWRRPRQVSQVAPFSVPRLKAGRNLPRGRR
ncbi:MAG: hypothetical protein K6V97_04795 [Actinomycetia bacterium]|nr:hypothetical protein [Actinomycetes bacterium]